MPSENNGKILAQVKRWVAQSGLVVTSISYDSKNDFVVSFEEARNLPTVQAVHQKGDSPFVLLVGQVSIPKDDREKLKNAMHEQFDDLIWDVKMRLLQLNVDFTVVGLESDPDAWEVQKRVLLGERHATNFLEAYSKVKYGLIDVVWSYKRALGSVRN